MKKFTVSVVTALFVLNSLPVYALNELPITQENEVMSAESHPGTAENTVIRQNNLLQMTTGAVITPTITISIPFSLGINDDDASVSFQKDAFWYTDADGVKHTGSFNEGTLKGTVSFSSGHWNYSYSFNFKTKDSFYALESIGVESVKSGGCGPDEVQNQLFEYNDNGDLSKYKFIKEAGLGISQITAEATVNDFWSLSYSYKSEDINGEHITEFDTTVNKNSLAGFTKKNWVSNVLLIYGGAHTMSVTNNETNSIRTESVKNSQGQFEQRLTKVVDGETTTHYVIQGNSNLLFVQDQSPLGLENYTVRYGKYFEDGEYKGYGFVLKNADGAEILLNYSDGAEITLNDKTYIMTLHADGFFEFQEKIINTNGQISPFQDSRPGNLIIWNLSNLPTKTREGSESVTDGTAFDHLEIYRRAPGAVDEELVTTLNYLTTQYMDYAIDPNQLLRNNYQYRIVLYNKSGASTSMITGSIRIHYGYDSDLQGGDLQPENVLVLASNTVNGRKEALLPDGTDIVDYYANARGIPAENVLRLNVTDTRFNNLQAFQEQVLNPIYNYLVANNLTDQITAITTMPGAHMTFQVGVGGGFSIDYVEVPAESVIAGIIPKMIQGKPYTLFYKETEYVSGRVLSGFNDTLDTGQMLSSILGYTRMDAPALTADFTTGAFLANGHTEADLLSVLTQSIQFNSATLVPVSTVFSKFDPNRLMNSLNQYITSQHDSGDPEPRDLFLNAYVNDFMAQTVDSTDAQVVETRNLLGRSNLSSLEKQLIVRNMLEIFFPGYFVKNKGIKTEAENLKRIIDQTIAAENEAKRLASEGVGAEHYAFIFDVTDRNFTMNDYLLKRIPASTYEIKSAQRMLSAYGYTTYLDSSSANISSSHPITDDAFLQSLASGDTELAGFYGRYFPTNYDQTYNYLESLSPDGFADGSFINPADDSSFLSGFNALKRDGVVMASANHAEPNVSFSANGLGAYVYTGTSLAYAAAMSQSNQNWMAIIYGDPLYNMGKYILGPPKTTVNAEGQVITTQLVQAGKLHTELPLELANPQPEDFFNHPRQGVVSYSYDSTGRIIESTFNFGTEFYHADGTKTFTANDGNISYDFDSLGRIVRYSRTFYNYTTMQYETVVQTYTY